MSSFPRNCFYVTQRRLFAFALYCFAVRVWELGMVITQWESHGNENNETGIPCEWEYDLNFGGGNGVEWELTAWE